MKKTWILLLLIATGLVSCVKISQEPVRTPVSVFITSTLPPTKVSLLLPTAILPTSTPDASTTTTPGTPDGTADTTSAASGGTCQDSAILVQDVTVPDNAQMARSTKFTKTWRFMNNGKCKWSGYTISFVSGDRM